MNFSTPSTSRIPLGKRTADRAGLDQQPGEPPSTVRRTNLLLQQDLERRLRSAQARELELQTQLDDARREAEAAREINRRLVEDDTWREEEAKGLKTQEEADRRKSQNTITQLRNELMALQNSHATLSHDADAARRDARSKHGALSNELQLLSTKLGHAEEDAREERARADELAAEVKALRARVGELVEEVETARREDGEEKMGQVLRDELSRQAKNLQSQDALMTSQKAELTVLRQRRDDVEALKQEMKTSERTWSDKWLRAEDLASRYRDDLNAIASSSKSASAPSSDAANALEAQLQTAVSLHQASLATLSTREAELSALHSRLESVTASSRAALAALSLRADGAERDAARAEDGRRTAEMRVELLGRELRGLRGMKGGGSGGEERIRQLEGLVESYQERMGQVEEDRREEEQRVAEGKGYVKKEEAEALRQRIEELSADASKLSTLEADNVALTAEVEDLKAATDQLERRVASGDYNPQTLRCLQMAINPSTQDLAVRTATLDALKEENRSLLDQLAGRADVGHSVPRSSYDAMVRDKDKLVADSEKRRQRLMEIFQLKTTELLNALHAILGFTIKLKDDGDVLLQSAYAPKGKSGVTFLFKSHEGEGHYGTMKLTGALAASLDEQRDFWVTQRQSIPCFLAASALELYERTTRGRAAGWHVLDGQDD